MTEAELDLVLKHCGCGLSHSDGETGECDVPALVAEVRRLRGALGLLRECARTGHVDDCHNAGDPEDCSPLCKSVRAFLASAIRSRT